VTHLPVHRPRVSILTVAAGALLALAAPSFSAPFKLLIVDTGGTPGSLGNPITPSVGTFFRAEGVPAMGIPPSPEAVALSPVLQYSSYIALGGAPVHSGQAALPPAGMIGPQFGGFLSGASGGPTEITGVRYTFPILVIDPIANPFMVPPASSGMGPLGADSVFIGRCTVRRGARPVGSLIYVAAQFEDKTTLSVAATLDAVSVMTDSGGSSGTTTALRVRSDFSYQVNIEDWGDADVYDLYVVSETAPKKPAKAAKPKAKTAVKTPKTPVAKSPKPTLPKAGTGRTPFPQDNIIYRPSAMPKVSAPPVSTSTVWGSALNGSANSTPAQAPNQPIAQSLLEGMGIK